MRLSVAPMADRSDRHFRSLVVAIPRGVDERCQVAAVLAWRRLTGGTGRVFPISGRTVARIVKRLVKRFGVDENE